ncbi:ABC transporter ATP-binding protein [Portibacter marinus]|uniref:ABC transporter ATP-binding protein n=1 Tax=Portibacter marinus TaxID=2898660 RepID=UPI001F3F1C08|nr:ABC transporter ATP-binding protein [Portibacter marinus]
MELAIKDLEKIYPNGTKALAEVNLTIGVGMFGLLGPNGAGKSTLMRTIATLQKPDKGTISFNNIDILKNEMSLRKRLGYLPQEFGVYPRMSARNLLDYLAQLKGVASKSRRKEWVNYCLELTNLSDVAHQKVSGYSGGMKQRFGIAQLLLNDPQLIIVDEPTAGLDPEERQRFLNVLRAIGRNCIVIFSTHIVEDIKQLCTDMAIMNEGLILERCKPEEALKRIKHKIYVVDIEESKVPALKEKHVVLSTKFVKNDRVSVRIFSEHQLSPPFAQASANLEDFYFITLKKGHV